MRLLQRLKNLFLPEGEVSDGFHTFDELYHYRMLYNAAFSIGLLLVTTDRLIEVNKYNNERRRISQEA